MLSGNTWYVLWLIGREVTFRMVVGKKTPN